MSVESPLFEDSRPLTLWETNMINIPDDSLLIKFEEYGIDYNGPVPNVVIDNNVLVPDSEVKITEG